MKLKKTIILLIFTVMLFSSGCSNNAAKNAKNANNTKNNNAVTYYVVKKGNLQSTIAGVLSPSGNNQSSLFFKDVSGVLSKVNVQVNDTVKSGQVLAEIDPSDINKSIAQQQLVVQKAKFALDNEISLEKSANEGLQAANADLNTANLNLAKQSTDVNNSIVTSAQYKVQQLQDSINSIEITKKSAQTDIDIANLQLAKLNSQLEACKIKSPVDGVVSFLDNVFVSDYINANKTVIKVMDKNNVIAVFTSSDLSSVNKGTKVKIKFNNTVYDAEIGDIENDNSSDNQSSEGTKINLKIASNKLNLTANSKINATMEIQNKTNILLVPKAAVFTDGDAFWVNVSENGKITKKTIQVGVQTSTQAEILDGLKEGDKIVLNY